MNIQEDQFASYKLLANALAPKKYSLAITSTSPTVVTLSRPDGMKWKTRAANITYPFNDQRVKDISIDKGRAYKLVEKLGFPIPYTETVSGDLDDELATRMLSAYPLLIVKPSDSSLSRGLTLNIDTKVKLYKAIKNAQLVSPSVLIQEQVKGEEIRFAVINGRVEAALLRRTARVVGNGVSTIEELIKQENETRKTLKFEYISYPQLDDTIVDQSLLNSQVVPRDKEVIELSHSTMIRGGCSVYNVLDEVDESYKKIVEKIAADISAGFVVVDMFCQKYKTAATRGNYWFIEFNSAPVLKLFYGCRDAKHFDIVTRLADLIDETLASEDVDKSSKLC